MRLTTAGMLVALAGLAVAAPVPKEKAKLEDVFGEITDKKSDCKFDLNKDGALVVTVPTTHPTFEPGTASPSPPPMVGKKVTGDFVLTLRTTVAMPKAADVKGHTFQPAVMTGVSIVATDSSDIGTVIGTVRRMKGDHWTVTNFLSSWEPLRGAIGPVLSNVEIGSKAKPDDAVWLRITRRKWLVEVETSDDGTTWATFTPVKVKQWGDTVSVGPVAFGCIDKEFTATFDHYEIKPLKDEKK